MPFKYQDGHIVLQEVEGQQLPVFIHADGKESPFDAEKALQRVREANSEAKAHREAKEAVEERLKAFDGFEPDAARKAISTVAELTTELASTRSALHAEKISAAFGRSRFVAEKLALPGDLVHKMFADRFKVEGGKVIATTPEGNPMFSAERPSEFADFEEAIRTMVDAYPSRDMILKGSGASGGGAAGGGSPARNALTREEFNAMPHAQRSDFFKRGGVLTD